MNSMLGNVGHMGIVVGLVASLAAMVSYYYASRSGGAERQAWVSMGRGVFGAHAAGVVLAVVMLFLILYQHDYRYYYAWKHSSNSLPLHFIISCFWEGQEGSFLIWIFWNALVGLILIRSTNRREPSLMMVFCLIQCLLLSMVLGSYVSPDWKIGSSPFALLKDAVDMPVFALDPGFVPADGTGLNPLLQNIWMVIHPPVIFLGFAVSAVPFAACLGGLLARDPHGWIELAHRWLLVAVGVLGLGIMMGAYWAYETLNFGGYWNWDPVENAVLVPWLTMLAALHGILLYKKKRRGLTFTTLLTLAGFGLVVYATFLTRSGILGEASVHAFTDLDLFNQLLLFVLVISLLSVYALAINYRAWVTSQADTPVYSLDFWMALGLVVMGLATFQVLLPTSIPVWNALLETVGLDSRVAPPADQVAFYGQFQVWFAALFGLTAGVAQLIYWKNVRSPQSLEKVLAFPVLIALLISSMIILLAKVHDGAYILLVTMAVYGWVAGAYTVVYLARRQGTTFGGGLAHMGFATMLVGFVFSAGYSEIVSRNLQINAPESSLPVHTIQENRLLSRDQPVTLGEYAVTYRGARQRSADGSLLLKGDALLPTTDPSLKVLKAPHYEAGQLRARRGDTVAVEVENTYYELEVSDGKKSFTMLPRMQDNQAMGMIASPAIASSLSHDLYLHVTNFPDPQKVKWSKPEYREIVPGRSVTHAGLRITLKGSRIDRGVAGVPTGENTVTIVADLEVSDGQHTYQAQPVFLIMDGKVRLYPDVVSPLGVKIVLDKIDPDSQRMRLAVSTSQRDWITVKAIKMPLINLVWIGTLLVLLGVGVALYARISPSVPRHQPLIPDAQQLKKLPPASVPEEVCLAGEV